jgi:hypothetical protein
MSPPFSGSKNSQARNQNEAEQKIVATCPSETSLDFQQTTQCYIPEDRVLQVTYFSAKKKFGIISV